MQNYSWLDLSQQGIEVCASCGGANINANWKIKIETLPLEWCFNCQHSEGTSLCMPDDTTFYPLAKQTIKKLNKGIKC